MASIGKASNPRRVPAKARVSERGKLLIPHIAASQGVPIGALFDAKIAEMTAESRHTTLQARAS